MQLFNLTVVNDVAPVQEDVDANLPLPRIVASLFMSPGGDKIYQLLFYFSSHVLEHCIRHENGTRLG